MSTVASQITGISTVYSGGRSKKTLKLHVTGLCEGNPLVDSPHKGPVMQKMFPFDDAIMGKYDVCSTSVIATLYTVKYGGLIDMIRPDGTEWPK